MAKSNKNLFGAPKVPASQKSRIAAPVKASAPKDASARSLSVVSATKSSAINFGSFRPKATTTTQASPWSALLQHATSGGIASALGGGLSAIAGLGGLFSGILGLFGGSNSTVAPVQFALPKAQQDTLTLHQQTSPTASIESSLSTTTPVGAGGATNIPGTQTINVAYRPSIPAVDHSQVVQVVKQALLTSSSLNDVIAEI